MAIELLHRMRGIVLELLAAAYGGARPLKFIDQADASLQACLGATLAQPDLSSLKQALGRFLDLLENDLTRFIGCHLSDPQRRVLQQARLRQAQLR
jgi:hypothetical protein